MILWATSLSRTSLLAQLDQGLKTHDTVVVRADVRNRTWGEQALSRLRGWNGRVFAYIRGVGHYNYKAVAGDGYEWVCKQLIEHSGAGPLKHVNSGQIITHKDRYGNWYDAYTKPSQVPLRELAKVTAALAYEKGLYDGFLIDGVSTWFINSPDPMNSDYGPELNGQYKRIAQKQYACLTDFVRYVQMEIPGVKIVGNGSWEPMLVGVKPYRFQGWEPDPRFRWEYSSKPPLITPSKWMYLLDGAMDEDGARVADRIPPYYHEGSPFQQGPRVSQTLSMHVQCAKDWLAVGKEYWVGGLANANAYPQGVQRIG